MWGEGVWIERGVGRKQVILERAEKVGREKLVIG